MIYNLVFLNFYILKLSTRTHTLYLYELMTVFFFFLIIEKKSQTDYSLEKRVPCFFPTPLKIGFTKEMQEMEPE